MTASQSPTLVSDTFHFSSYYWRESYSNLESLQADSNDGSEFSAGSSDGQVFALKDRVRSTSVTSDGEEYLSPRPVPKNNNRIKLKFYDHVMGDGTENIHFGKWDGIDIDQSGAYGRASDAMTQYMYRLSLSLLPHRAEAHDFRYVDLGSGNGAAAIRLVERNRNIVEATCLNLCHEQNMAAEEKAADKGLAGRIKTVESSFDDTPCPSNYYDLAFSQDAFIHSFTKLMTFTEAYRITKPGGAFVFCDLMCGDNPDLTAEALAQFAQKNRLNDWLDPSQVIDACKTSGWKDVQFIDLTTDLRISFQLMRKKVSFVLEHGDTGKNDNRVQLMNYRDSICHRITQIDRGVFKWGVVHARKPVCMKLACKPPVPFTNSNHLILLEQGNDEKHIQNANVVVVDILQKMSKEKIEALPSTVNLLVTMSVGLDHIDTLTCAEKDIVIKQSGRDAITSHVVQYMLSFIILGLRDALNQLSVPFPAQGWNLNWNCDGKPLTSATIAIVGMGVIAKTLVKEMRKLAPKARIIYNVPASMRDFDIESKFDVEFIEELETLAALCDVLLPLCPLTKQTDNLINKEILKQLKPTAGLINMSRGKVVNTDAITEALENRTLKYAILDTTFPEPLPPNHALWGKNNCFIFPHYATNTMAVREALVGEVQQIIEDHFGLGHSDERAKAEEKVLRYDLAVAHRLTAQYGMSMLVWNHISARFRTGCIITPGRKLWSKIEPRDLVYTSSNVTADIIHDAIYSARPDAKAIIHLHTPAATAVSCLEGGFKALTQDSAYFYGKVAHYDWDGLSNESSEGSQIQDAILRVKGCNTLLMYNHGFVCFGSSVREAWVLAYYFERCCEVQLRVMQCGGKVRLPPKTVMENAAKASYLPEFAPGSCEWEALCEDISFT